MKETSSDMLFYRLESIEDENAILQLHQSRLGPGRYAKSSYRVREQASHDIALSFVAYDGDDLVASVRQTWIKWNNGAIWSYLGPLVVHPNWGNKGLGVELLKKAASAAYEKGAEAILLVGDLPYYQRAGYAPCQNWGVTPLFPGPTALHRALMLLLPFQNALQPENIPPLQQEAKSYVSFVPFKNNISSS